MSKHNKKNTLSILEDIATTFNPSMEKQEDEQCILYPITFRSPITNENVYLSLIYNKDSKSVLVGAEFLEAPDRKKFTDCLYMVNELNRLVPYVTFSYEYEKNSIFVGRELISFNGHSITHDDVLAGITGVLAPFNSVQTTCQAFIEGKVLRELLPLALLKAHNAFVHDEEEEENAE
ncbi:MAG: hypothetical protein ACI37Z_08930 [Candidatus Gastranaerophilaceae bacterium]